MTSSATFDFSGTTIVVTGGSRGIGRACVVLFAQCGADVFFTWRSDEEATKRLLAEVEALPGNVTAVQADATNPAQTVAVINTVVSKQKSIDCIVCNVSNSKYVPFHEMTQQDWDSSIAGTLTSAANYARAAAVEMVKQRRGNIIFISSVNGIRGRVGSSAYGAAKAGLNHLVRSLARELGEFNIRANAIAPGYVNTEGQKNTPALIKKLVRDETPLNEVTESSDVANAVAFLASDAAARITGHTLVLDAGQTA